MVLVGSRHCFWNPGHLKETKPEIRRQRCELWEALGRGDGALRERVQQEQCGRARVKDEHSLFLDVFLGVVL